MLDARTQVQVRLDALRARTAALARRDLPAEARQLVDDVVEQQVLIDAVLSRAANVEDVTDVDAEIEDAFVSIDQAAAMIGEYMPADAPFAGLCAIDPAHGPATGVGHDGAPATCQNCEAAAHRGERLDRRQVTRSGRPVPFDELAESETTPGLPS
jgi:hypothetical protein